MDTPAVIISSERDGRLLRLTLSRPKPNLIDAEMISALQTALDQQTQRTELAALLLDAAGPGFSYGASVSEHLPAQCAQMLADLHRLLITLIELPLPVLVAVHGYCLGGGMELACTGNMIFAAPDSRFGQPEIQIGVFAPAAS